MSHSHIRQLVEWNPGIESKVLLLREDGISDPIGGDLEAYRTCAREIEAAIQDILKDFRGGRRLAAGGRGGPAAGVQGGHLGIETMAEKTKEEFQIANDPLWYKDAIIYEFTSGPSTTRTVMASGISEDWPRSSAISRTWASPRSGSCRSTPRLSRTTATTSPTSPTSIRPSARCATSDLPPRGAPPGAPGHHRTGLNHTSDQHPGSSVRGRRAAEAPARLLRVERDSDRYRDARDHLQGLRVLQLGLGPVAKAYYWHRFYSHQPDLNYDNPQVQRPCSGAGLLARDGRRRPAAGRGALPLRA
jgi:hypothetical protein